MGDTFNSVGGHNLLEPAINNNIILTGPNIITCKHQINLIPHFYLNNDLDELTKNINNIIKSYNFRKIYNDIKLEKIKEKIINKLENIINLSYK